MSRAPPPRRQRAGAPPAPSRSSGSRSPDLELQAFLTSSAASRSSADLAAQSARLEKGGVSLGKTRWERERDEAERKRVEEEKRAAEAYEVFVRDMQGDDEGAAGADGQTRKAPKAVGFVRAGGSKYAPTARAAAAAAAAPSSSAPQRAGLGASRAFGEEESDEDEASFLRKPVAAAIPTAPRAMSAFQPAAASATAAAAEESFDEASSRRKGPPTQRKTAKESFVEELAREQAAREERLRGRIGEGTSLSAVLAAEGAPRGGSRDTGSLASTNVCIQGLPGDITEAQLGVFMARWGDVGSAKIMYPREHRPEMGAGARSNLVGFVSYMERRDAEYAIREADGAIWGGPGSNGPLLRMGWGKAVPNPPRARFPQSSAGRSEARTSRRSQSPTRLRARSPASGPRPHRRSSRRARSTSPRTSLRTRMTAQNAEVERLISDVAARVREYGMAFAEMVKARESGNSKFAFLDDERDGLEQRYFRSLWDPNYRPPLEPRPFVDEGSDSLYSSDTEEESEVEVMRRTRSGEALGKAARRRFEAMLRGLTPRRERIARAMAFAIERAYAADEIADILTVAIVQPLTPLPRKLARLHLLSDILHNAAAPLPNAWRYRAAFEVKLPVIFAHLADVARALGGRIRQETWRASVRAVLEVWESWLVWSPEEISRLARVLEGEES